MPNGIIIFGANGSGKSTLGRELAQILHWKYMDIETYHFMEAEIPYTASRPRADCIRLMCADMELHRSFVLSAVTGDFGAQIMSWYTRAIWVSAPLETRLERIEHRARVKYRDRVEKGGDIYEQHLQFLNFVASRSLLEIAQWAKTLPCPIQHVDGTMPVSENVRRIVPG